MSLRKIRFFLPVVLGVLLIVGSLMLFFPASHASAQCGSQASSCKNCHEVQGKDPVNNDGNPWHESHAFGDFCAVCHGGNSQSMDEAAAHTGMEDPLSDVKAACQQCHVDDLDARAKVYADILGVEVGGGEAAAATENQPSGEGESSGGDCIGLMMPTDLTVDDPNETDYVQRYQELALGRHPLNKGNAILGILIGLVVLGGGAFVLYNEGWMNAGAAEEEMLADEISRLSPSARETLKKILQNPDEAEETLRRFEK